MLLDLFYLVPMNRRQFINLFSISLLVNFLPMSLAISYAKSTSKSENKNQVSTSKDWIVAGTVKEINETGQIFRDKSPYGAVLLIRDTQSEKLIAINSTCTHLGCNVDWEAKENIFLCPCHASEFNYNGEVKNGPATEPLGIYETKIESGNIMVRPVKN